MPKDFKFSYWYMYLLHYLKEHNDPRKDDEQYLQHRCEDAAEEYEESQKDGREKAEAQERAMYVLMRDFHDEE